MTKDNTLFVISALCPDRPGIIADVTEALFELGGNLESISQTIMQGWFTMLLSCSFPSDMTDGRVAHVLAGLEGIHFAVRPASEETVENAVQGEPYVLTAIGEDKPGIVRSLSRCCAERGVNIADVWNEVRAGQFITIFHVLVPRTVYPGDFRGSLEREGAEIGVSVTLQHQDIFTATNSLQVYTRRG